MTTKKLYFGHPKSTFYTPKEQTITDLIQEEFPDYEIETPSSGIHRANSKLYKIAFNNSRLYFYNEVIPRCEKGVFLPYPDGNYDLYVWNEANFMKGLGREIYEFDPVYHDIMKLTILDKTKRLTLDETIERNSIL